MVKVNTWWPVHDGLALDDGLMLVVGVGAPDGLIVEAGDGLWMGVGVAARLPHATARPMQHVETTTCRQRVCAAFRRRD